MDELGSATNPVHFKQVPDTEDTYLAVLNVVTKTIMAAYTILTAWEIAKVICPPLAVHQQIGMARLKRWCHKNLTKLPPEVHVPHGWVREIYDDLRSGEVPDGT